MVDVGGGGKRDWWEETEEARELWPVLLKFKLSAGVYADACNHR